MTSNIPKPENALKKAEKLISAGQHYEALNVLHGTITHRRLRAIGWDVSTELIMLRYVKLCVELEKLKPLREGLYFYRVLTQSLNVISFAKVLKKLRDLSESKLESVKAKAYSQDLAKGVEDLEADETPESLILATLQVEIRDETARALHSALLGCWETYKIILDALRLSPRIDYLYHDTAQRALLFCRNNKRPLEFKRLCDFLRLQYIFFQKNRQKPEYDALASPENHLTTKLTEMEVAASLELWNQCYQAAEDILNLGLHESLQHSLFNRDNVVPKTRSLLLLQTSLFYEKLAEMFFVSDQRLFHAAAVLRHLFHMFQHKKTSAETEKTKLCDLATIAVLNVPLFQKQTESVAELEHQKKLATMLSHSIIPTRNSMKNIIETRNVVASASPEVQKLYHIVEGEIDPMTICLEAEEVIKSISDLSYVQPYIRAIKEVVLEKLIHHLSSIYTIMSLNFFSNFICKPSFLSSSESEVLIADLVSSGIVKLRFDHVSKVIIFEEDLITLNNHLEKNQLVDVITSVTEQIPNMKSLDSAVYLTEADLNKLEFYDNLSAKVINEVDRLKQRNSKVAERRLKQEKEQQAKEEARRTEEKEKQKKEEQEEQSRREAALKYQELLRRKEARNLLKINISKQIVEDFKALADKTIGKIIIKRRPIDEISVDHILNGEYSYEDYEKAIEELKSRERQEKNRLYRQESKRVEHLIRAIREVEAKFLKEWQEKICANDKKLVSEINEIQEKQAEKDHMKRLAIQETLMHVEPVVKSWIAPTIEQRYVEYRNEVEKRTLNIKQLIKIEKVNRAKERKNAYLERIKEEEEEKRLEEEKLKSREKEEILERCAAKQRLKQQEIDEHLQNKQKELELQRQDKTVHDSWNYQPNVSYEYKKSNLPEYRTDVRARSNIAQNDALVRKKYGQPKNKPVMQSDYTSRRNNRYELGLSDTSWTEDTAATPKVQAQPFVTQIPYKNSSKPHTDNEGFTTVNARQKPRQKN